MPRAFPAALAAVFALTATAVAQPPSLADRLAAFRAERAEAAKTFAAAELAAADELAARAEAAQKAGRADAALRLARDARWQVPFLPPNLPPHVTRVLGVARLRHSDRVNAVAFSPDGTRLASASRDSTVKVWDLGNGRELLTYRGHVAPAAEDEDINVLRVPAVAYSPDGKTIASSGRTDVHVWDAATGKLLHTLAGHKQPCRAVAFIDPNTLITGGDDRRVVVWDVAKAKPAYEFPEQSQRVEAVAVGAKGTLAATVNAAGELLVYALGGKNLTPVQTANVTAAGQPGFGVGFAGSAGVISAGGDAIAKLTAPPDLAAMNPTPPPVVRMYTGHTEKIHALAVSADGTALVTVGKDATVRVWDVNTGRPLRAFQGHATPVTAVAVSPDGTQIASGGDDGQVRLWPLSATDEHRALTDATEQLWAVAVSPDGSRFATAGADRTIRVYRADTGTLEKSLAGHTGAVPTLAFVGNDRLASGAGDKLVKLWSLADGTARDLAGHESAVLAVAAGPGGMVLFTGSADKSVMAWDAATGKLLWTWAGKSAVCALAVRPDGKRVAVGAANGSLTLLETEGDKPGVSGVVSAHGAGVAGVSFHPDGTRVATCGGDGAVRVWAVPGDGGEITRGLAIEPTGTASANGKAVPPAAAAVAYSPDGRFLAYGGADAVARVWDTQTGSELRGLRGHSDWVTAVAFAPDGKTLYSAGTDKVARAFELGRPDAAAVGGHTQPVRCVAVSRDGKLAATGSGDRTVKVWELASGREAATLLGATDVVNAVAFADPGTVVTAGKDARVRWWAVAGGREVRSVPSGQAFVLAAAGPRVAVVWTRELEKTAGLELFADGADPVLVRDQGRELSAAALSADATLAVTGGEDGVLRVWDLAKQERVGGDWPLFAKRVADIVLTPDAKTLVAIDEAGAVKVADVAKREAATAVAAVGGEAVGLAVAAAGDKFATLTADGTVKAWDAKGTELRAWKLPVPPAAAAFTPDGKQLVTGTRDGTAFVLALP